jgi:tRNA (mo5U34)-methyltransferase
VTPSIATAPAAPCPKRPPKLNEGTLFEGIHWHQQWEIFEGVHTPGRNPVNELLAHAAVPIDLTGKTVLDVGPWNGCFSFECARRGASRVVGIGPDDPAITGFHRLQALLQAPNVDYVRGSVYDLDVQTIGKFDIVLFFGVLYHLRYPLLALDKLYEVCAEDLYLESFVTDNCLIMGQEREPRLLSSIDPRLSETPIWQFYQFDELNQDSSNWFGPNLCALVAALESAGFKVQHSESWGHRAAVWSRKFERQFHKLRTYENDPIVAKSVRLRFSD